MNVAIVHELLTMKGGAERVARVLARMFPDAPIYTLLYDQKKLGDWFPPERVQTSTLQKRAWSMNHHLYLNKFPAAAEAWDFSEFDLVISSSSAFAHGIITNGNPKHISYVHSPARYLWDRTHDVLDQAGKGMLGPLKRRYLERIFHKLRIWDSEAAARPDALIAASKEVQRRIELYWRRDSEVVHPSIDNFWLQGLGLGSGSEINRPEPYFLVVSTLAPYKRIDLAIEACNKLGANLKIAGSGPDLGRLKNMARSTIEFVGHKDAEDLKDLYQHAQAVIFPGDEDFGLVPLEAMACGTPVIAYESGGALETVIEGKTGTFFDEPTAESLQDVILSLSKDEQKNYSKEECIEHAQQFSEKRFENEIRSAIDNL